MTVSGGVEPCSVVKTHSVDDERIPFPLTGRVPEIGRIRIFRLLSAVQPNVTPNMSPAFVYENDTFRKLEDFSWIRGVHHSWNSGRQTEALGILFRIRRLSRFECLSTEFSEGYINA